MPAFPFGHGLSYTSFGYGGLSAQVSGSSVTARFDIANTGQVAGKEVAQVYVSGPGIDAPKRLGGFDKVALAPGERKPVAILIDPRTFASFNRAAGGWRVAGGTYRLHLARSASDIVQSIAVQLPAMAVPTKN